MPSGGRPEIICACSVVRTVLSNPSSRKASPTPEVKPSMKAKARLRGILGSTGSGGNAGDIDDAEVVGVEAGGDPGFLQFSPAVLHKAAIAIEIALQQAVFDGALVELVRFLLLFFESVVQHVFALQGRHILPADLARDFLGFGENLRVDLFQLIIQSAPVSDKTVRTECSVPRPGSSSRPALVRRLSSSPEADWRSRSGRVQRSWLPKRWCRCPRTAPDGRPIPCPCARIPRQSAPCSTHRASAVVMFCFSSMPRISCSFW